MPSSRRWVRSSLAFAFVAPLLVAAVAGAAQPCGDQTCPKNWECKTGTEPSPGIACAPGQDCPTPEPTTYQYCSPLPCTTDADCESDMVCHTETSVECSDPPPCAKGADCAAPADSGCTPKTESACVPRYVLACNTAADCGTGFTCEQAEPSCSCAGSAGSGGGAAPSAGGSAGSSGSGSGGSDGKQAPVPPANNPAEPAQDGGASPPSDGPTPPDGGTPDLPPPDCVCTPSTEKACKLTVVACTVDKDCPQGFSCEDNPSGDCWASSDGSSGCTTPDPAKLCAPPYTDLVRGGVAEDSSGNTGSTATGNAPPPKGSPSEGSGAPADPVPAAHSGTPSPPSGAATTDDSGGCSVAAPRGTHGAGLGLAALALVGLLGVRRRRAS